MLGCGGYGLALLKNRLRQAMLWGSSAWRGCCPLPVLWLEPPDQIRLQISIFGRSQTFDLSPTLLSRASRPNLTSARLKPPETLKLWSLAYHWQCTSVTHQAIAVGSPTTTYTNNARFTYKAMRLPIQQVHRPSTSSLLCRSREAV
jgi:hypothetical protein